MFVMTYPHGAKGRQRRDLHNSLRLVCSTATATTFLGPARLSHWGQIREGDPKPKTLESAWPIAYILNPKPTLKP